MELSKKKLLIRFLVYTLVLFVLVGAFVWFFDPFYQYHKPFPGIKAVLNDRDNQMPGTIRTFDYDTLLVGSSVAENFNSRYLDEQYACRTLKVIRASGSMADLLYYVNMAEERRELKQIVWCLDLFALDAPVEVTLYGDDIPRYLHTETIWDDIPYLYNKEIIFEKIPAMLVSSLQGVNVGGDAYNWSKGKDFSAAGAMRFYKRPVVNEEPGEIPISEYEGIVRENIDLLVEQVKAHPEIQYRFLFPPYSLLWWDSSWVNGYLEERIHILEQTMDALLPFDNVEIYYYQNDEEIVCNLDNYMDLVHYSPAINQLMLERMIVGVGRITPDNMEEEIEKMRQLVQRITSTEIYRYYPET